MNQRRAILYVTERKKKQFTILMYIISNGFFKKSMFFLQKKMTHFLIMIAGSGSMIEIMKAI